MASVVQGKACVFQVNITGSYKTVVCAKSFSIVTAVDTVEITTIDVAGADPESGIWKDYDHDSISYTLTLDGVMKITDSTNDTVWEALSAAIQFVEVPFKLVFTDPEANAKTVEGTAIITNVSLSATPNALVQQSISFIGKGKYTVT